MQIKTPISTKVQNNQQLNDILEIVLSFLNCSSGQGKLKLPSTIPYIKMDEIIILIMVFTLWIAILSLFFHRCV